MVYKEYLDKNDRTNLCPLKNKLVETRYTIAIAITVFNFKTL